MHPIVDKKHKHESGAASASMTMRSRGFQSGGYSLLSATGNGGQQAVTPSYQFSLNSSTSNLSFTSTGGNETRPDNAGVRYCIKY